MPELPEVETVRLTIWPQIAGRRIERVIVAHPDVVGGGWSVDEFTAWLTGTTFAEAGRRGKYLVFTLRRDDASSVDGGPPQFEVLVHLRMTGKLACAAPEDEPPPHTHLRLVLDDGCELRFTDTRRFGRWTVLAGGDAAAKAPRGYQELGPEPLSGAFDGETLGRSLRGRHGKLKAALLDQRVVAGIGNIYADEILFRAGLHPATRASSLSPEQIVRLAEVTRAVLSEAIGQGGTTIRDYVDGRGQRGDFVYSLCVYGRGGKPCPVCERPVEKVGIAGRSTHYCPGCQPWRP